MENVNNLLSVGALTAPTLLLPLAATRLPRGCPLFCLLPDSLLSKTPAPQCYICLGLKELLINRRLFFFSFTSFILADVSLKL